VAENLPERSEEGPRPEPGVMPSFVSAGRALVSLGLVRGAEGNLSVFDGERLVITRAGSSLGALTEGDLVVGTLDRTHPDSSSDLAVHVQRYRERGRGAVAHAHPAGTVSEGRTEPGEHGMYVFAPTLEGAVEEVVRRARARGPR
jgi:hypothetical protein